MNLQKNQQIEGFSYEPELSIPDSELMVNYDVDNEESQTSKLSLRNAINISEWWKCQRCSAIPTQKKMRCCHELDEIKYNLLGGELAFLKLGKNSSFVIEW